VASQPKAPQIRSAVEQALVQQLPLPLAPQTPEVQSSFCEQDPVATFGPQMPVLQYDPVAQSAVAPQEAKQAVPAELQLRLLGHAEVAAVQAPVASQAPAVSMWPEQVEVPQALPTG
jgi:hypothetical protein